MTLPFLFDRSRPGVWLSGAVHVALVLAGVVAFTTDRLPDAQEGIPVEVLTENQFSEITRGEATAAAVQPVPSPRVDRVDDMRVERPPAEAERDAPAPPKRPAEAKIADEEAEPPPPPPKRVVEAAKPEPVPPPPVRPEPSRDELAKAQAAKAEALKQEAAAKAEAVQAAAAAKQEAVAKAEASARAEAAARGEARREAVKLAQRQEAEEQAREDEAERKAEAKARADARADAEARAKVAAKAKADSEASAELDRKLKAVEAADAKAELERKLKTVEAAEAKIKAEADAKAKAEADAKAKAVAEAKAEAKAKAEAEARAKTLAQAKLKQEAEAKARRQAEAAEKFSPGDISKLLAAKEPAASSGATGREVQRTASLGTATGTAQRLNPSQRDQISGLIREQLIKCWQPPVAVQSAAKPPTAIIRLAIRQDGSLSAEPSLMNSSSDPLFRPVADSALRATRRCAPLRIPERFAPFYQDWKDLLVDFDPREVG